VWVDRRNIPIMRPFYALVDVKKKAVLDPSPERSSNSGYQS
jgi:hypothetical protein